MDFARNGGGSSGNTGGDHLGLGSESGPILYIEPNRTSAIDDIRSVVIYVFIITIFLSFFLVLPGLRNEKFPTFLCITTSLIVTSIILVSLFGTTWHVADAPISAAYKAFSRDRIQGDITVKIGLRSVNVTLVAHKYYILHSTHGPIIIHNTPVKSQLFSSKTDQSSTHDDKEHSHSSSKTPPRVHTDNLAVELLERQTSDGASVDVDLDLDEVFPQPASTSGRNTRSSLSSSSFSPLNSNSASQRKRSKTKSDGKGQTDSSKPEVEGEGETQQRWSSARKTSGQSPNVKYTIKRVNVDINYNERFYWIEPDQMRQEHHNALKRGLPFPILTVVEYLSQDDGGFSWARQYRLAGYYSHMILWFSLSICVLMFYLHCAAPKYAIYTLQIIGCLMLLTNFTYAKLVPRGEQKLVIPFEGQSLSFRFGWNFWLVLFGGCLSLLLGTLIVIVGKFHSNFRITTMLDVDFDNKYHRFKGGSKSDSIEETRNVLERPVKPPFIDEASIKTSYSKSSSKTSYSPTSNLSEKDQKGETSLVGSRIDSPIRRKGGEYNNGYLSDESNQSTRVSSSSSGLKNATFNDVKTTTPKMDGNLSAVEMVQKKNEQAKSIMSDNHLRNGLKSSLVIRSTSTSDHLQYNFNHRQNTVGQKTSNLKIMDHQTRLDVGDTKSGDGDTVKDDYHGRHVRLLSQKF